jgi:exosortase
MVHQWTVQPDYSHGFLVVPLAAYFLWSKRGDFPRNKLRPDIRGGGLLLVAAAMRVGAGKYFLGPLDGWTIPLWIAGVVWLIWGWPCLRWSLPAIAFLWFMIPIPFSAESLLSVPLQAISTKLSTM